MTKTSALPSGQLFDIDEIACLAAARVLSGYCPPRTRKPVPEGQKPEILALKVGIVAICHQFNWDVLTERLTKHLLQPGRLVVQTMRSVSSADLEEWFANSGQEDRLNAPDRSRILREVARTLDAEFGSNAMSIVERCQCKLKGPQGFLELMDRFAVFQEDPLRKKTNVLTHEIVRDGIAKFSDEENIAPAVDYHLMRLYLRTGRVYALHPSIFESLVESDPRPRERLVRQLRERVADALRVTARLAKLTIPDLNLIEWQIGRSICVKGQPGCASRIRSRPLDPQVAALFQGDCLYCDMCAAYLNKEWMRLQEPVFTKTFY